MVRSLLQREAFVHFTLKHYSFDYSIRSNPGHGTSVTASMRLSHIDRPPLGDLNATVLTLCAAGAEVDVQFDYWSDEDKFHFNSQETASKGKVCV